jgi:hypothetical protein
MTPLAKQDFKAIAVFVSIENQKEDSYYRLFKLLSGG